MHLAIENGNILMIFEALIFLKVYYSMLTDATMIGSYGTMK